MIALWVPWRWSKVHCANALTPGRLVGGNVIAIWGMCPYISSRGPAYPIDLFALEFNANSVMGNWSTQSHWSGHMVTHMIWMIVGIICLACPSPWGWEEVVIFRRTRCNACDA